MLVVKGKIPETISESGLRYQLSPHEYADFLKWVNPENVIMTEEGTYYYEKDLRRFLNHLAKPQKRKENKPFKKKEYRRGKR